MVFRRALGSVAAGVLLTAWACSGSSSSVGGPSAPTPTPAPAPTPAASPSPPAAQSCPKGTLDSTCVRSNPMYLTDVDTAINQLVQQRPEIFDLNNTSGPGGFFVKDAEAYYAGVIKNLEAMGFCAAFDLKELQVKKTNDFSEQYDILLGSGHIRRGTGSYRATCSPAVFPVDPSEFIDSIRVAFFGISCPDGRVPPRNGEGRLPVGCVGFVTATPKDKNNQDVDPRIHGPNIDWELRGGDEAVRVENVPNQAFNKNVYGLAIGEFILCAKVRGIEGCLIANVIP